MKYQDVITRIQNDDFHDDIIQLTDAMHAKVYLYNKSPKLIFKFLLGDQLQKIEFVNDLYNSISREDNLTTTIYEYGMTDIKDVTFTYTVQSYLEGHQVADYPEDSLIKLIVEGVYEFTKRMHEASSEYTDLGIPNAYEIFEYFLDNTPESNMKEVLKTVMSDDKFSSILSSDEQYLFHGDLWRQNILINENSISIIDIDPLFFGPKNMQLAILISAYFLLTKILNEGNDHIDFNYLISLWPEEVDKDEILYLMLYFPIFIGLGKEQIFIDSPVDETTYNNVMGPLFLVIEWIDKKLQK